MRATSVPYTACTSKASSILSGRGSEDGCPRHEGLLLAGGKKPDIVAISLWHSILTFALLNDANPTQVQKMMRYQRYATTEIYVEETHRLLE